MGLFDRFNRNRETGAAPAPAPAPEAAPSPVAAPASGSGTTQIDREHFLLHAPFEWKAVPSDQPLEFDFRNQTIPEQLMITVLIAREPFSGPKLREVAEQLTETRLKVLSRLTEGRSVASPVQYQSGSGQVEARCLARDDGKNIRYAWVIRVAPTKVVTVALTRYFTQEIGLLFEAYAGTIFDFLQVKNPGVPTGR